MEAVRPKLKAKSRKKAKKKSGKRKAELCRGAEENLDEVFLHGKLGELVVSTWSSVKRSVCTKYALLLLDSCE